MLEARLSKFGLKIAEDKSKIIEFGRYAWKRAQKESRMLATFDFLSLHTLLRQNQIWKVQAFDARLQVQSLDRKQRYGCVNKEKWLAKWLPGDEPINSEPFGKIDYLCGVLILFVVNLIFSLS
jgi:hypothetical protein